MVRSGRMGGAVDDAATIRESWTRPEAFGELAERHEPAVFRLISARLGHQVAEDLVAETFLVGFDRRRHYDLDQPDARPWLFGIATRLIAGHRRTEQRRLRALSRLDRHADTRPTDIEQAEDQMHAHALRGALTGALAALSAGDGTLCCWSY